MTRIQSKLLSFSRDSDDNDYYFRFLNLYTDKVSNQSLQLTDFLVVLSSMSNGYIPRFIEYAMNYLKQETVQIILELCQQNELSIIFECDGVNTNPVSLSGNLRLLKVRIRYLVYKDNNRDKFLDWHRNNNVDDIDIDDDLHDNGIANYVNDYNGFIDDNDYIGDNNYTYFDCCNQLSNRNTFKYVPHSI